MRMLIVALVMAMLLGAGPAMALPTLQVYIEGGTYDGGSETWLTTSSSFKLWIIGTWEPGYTLSDVRVSFAFAASEMATGTISLTPTTASPHAGITDTYATPAVGVKWTGIGANHLTQDLDGDGVVDPRPVMSDGGHLAPHGVFGVNTNWYQWKLGDMTHPDETFIADFQDEVVFPDSLTTQKGEIFAYDVSVSGFASGIHIDAFNHVVPPPTSASVFAPYSHDGGYDVPEPSSLLLLGGALVGYFGWSLKRRRR